MFMDGSAQDGRTSPGVELPRGARGAKVGLWPEDGVVINVTESAPAVLDAIRQRADNRWVVCLVNVRQSKFWSSTTSNILLIWSHARQIRTTRWQARGTYWKVNKQ